MDEYIKHSRTCHGDKLHGRLIRRETLEELRKEFKKRSKRLGVMKAEQSLPVKKLP